MNFVVFLVFSFAAIKHAISICSASYHYYISMCLNPWYYNGYYIMFFVFSNKMITEAIIIALLSIEESSTFVLDN